MRRLLVMLPFLASAGPPSDPDDLVRRGNAALLAGDPAAALSLYDAAGEHTRDPGLVAFNSGTALAQLGRPRDAELHFLRALDDREIPADRRTRSHYNRGVCLLQRPGPPDLAALRAAINCFEKCLAGSPDPAVAADARHNLELAKRLWADARSRQEKPPKAGELPPEEIPEPDPTPAPAGTDPAGDPGTAAGPQPTATPPPGIDPTPTDRPSPGTGPLPVLPDVGELQALSPEDTRAYLDRAAARLEKARRVGAGLRAGPERPGVRDW